MTSKNLSNQLINYKVIHRAYTKPYIRFWMRLQPNYICHLCDSNSLGTFLHMFWKCLRVASFWNYVNNVLVELVKTVYNPGPCLSLLNDDVMLI